MRLKIAHRRGGDCRALRGLAALLLAAALGGCASLIAGAPSAIFDLTAPGDAPAGAGQRAGARPRADDGRARSTPIGSPRGPTPSEYAYLPGAVWSDRLPKLLQTRLVQTLQNSGRARAVAVPGQGLLIDYQIVARRARLRATRRRARSPISSCGSWTTATAASSARAASATWFRSAGAGQRRRSCRRSTRRWTQPSSRSPTGRSAEPPEFLGVVIAKA